LDMLYCTGLMRRRPQSGSLTVRLFEACRGTTLACQWQFQPTALACLWLVGSSMQMGTPTLGKSERLRARARASPKSVMSFSKLDTGVQDLAQAPPDKELQFRATVRRSSWPVRMCIALTLCQLLLRLRGKITTHPPSVCTVQSHFHTTGALWLGATLHTGLQMAT
jgi:hypothetical protein